jgi:hypothetical protein
MIKDLIKSSYSFVDSKCTFDTENIKSFLDINQYWYCPTCDTQNSSNINKLKCSECDVFRPIELYTSFFKNHRFANNSDVELLKTRKVEEGKLINKFNEESHHNSYYMIDDYWLTKWENYVQNKEKDFGLQTKDDYNEMSAISHPGEITNNALERYAKDPDKSAYTSYRVINPQVWNALHRIYKGGLQIHRAKGYLTAEEALEDLIQTEFEKKIQNIKARKHLTIVVRPTKLRCPKK